jgi:xylose isomerase
MRNYKILAAKTAAFDADTEVQDILAANHADPDGVGALLKDYTPAGLKALEALDLDPETLAQRGHRYERLDQLAMEHLFGVR